MKKQNNTVGAVEAFLHDMEQGECEYSEIFNVMGVNELTHLVKMAKKGEEFEKAQESIIGALPEELLHVPCKGKGLRPYTSFDPKAETQEEVDCPGSVALWFDPSNHTAIGSCHICGFKQEFKLVPLGSSIGMNGVQSKDYIIGVDLARETTEEVVVVEESTTEPESIEGTKEN